MSVCVLGCLTLDFEYLLVLKLNSLLLLLLSEMCLLCIQLWFVSCFVLVILGPFKINGVPLRRVNQSYVIGTSTKVDVSAVNVDKFDDKYFSKEAQKKKKKGEGEFFESDK